MLSKFARAPMVIRYLVVGAFNTAFGYGCFALFTLLLTPLMSYAYVAASLLSNLLAVSFAFLGYKWFVFKTSGNYLREWIRCIGVYSVGIVLSTAALPAVVPIVRGLTGNAKTAPYLAGGIVMVVSIIVSFFGHRHISFAQNRSTTPPVR